MVPDVSPQKIKLDVQPTYLDFTGYSESKKANYHVRLDLYKEIDPSASKTNHTSRAVEFVLQKKDRAGLLRHALTSLSPEHGEVIDLVYYHGKSIKEVAEIVGAAEATVKTRMFYARKKLAYLVEAA